MRPFFFSTFNILTSTDHGCQGAGPHRLLFKLYGQILVEAVQLLLLRVERSGSVEAEQ